MKKLISKKYALQLINAKKAISVGHSEMADGKVAITIKNQDNNTEMYFIGEKADIFPVKEVQRKRIINA